MQRNRYSGARNFPRAAVQNIALGDGREGSDIDHFRTGIVFALTTVAPAKHFHVRNIHEYHT